MSEGTPNPTLRGYVTRVSFDLSLSHTQVEALVWLDLMRHHPMSERPRNPAIRFPIAHDSTWFVSAARKLEAKGLVVHRFRKGDATQTWNEIWSFTRAGDLMVDLLHEAGLYEDVASRMPEIEQRRRDE